VGIKGRLIALLIIIIVAAVGGVVSFSAHKSVKIFEIDFENKNFSGWRSGCGKCSFYLGHRQYVRKDLSLKNGFSGVYVGGHDRNESASAFLPLDKDLVIKWSLYFAEGFDSESFGTVSQLIGWQPNCFQGGLFHLRFEKGSWGYWLRNTPSGHDFKSEIKIAKAVWIDFVVKAKFTNSDNGYIKLKINQEGKEYNFNIIQGGATYKDCPRGPYFKAGLYGNFKGKDVLYVDNISAYYIGD